MTSSREAENNRAKAMIKTEHLQLVPHTPQQLLALIENPDRYEALSGFVAGAGLREFFVSGDVSPVFLASLHSTEGADPWRFGFAVIEPVIKSVIGTAGFKGPPDSLGAVEIAYGIIPEFEGRGYATECALALVAYASANHMRMVRAHTLPAPNASSRVLRKCGFGLVGEVTDPEDGLVWRWERSLLPRGWHEEDRTLHREV